MELDKESRIDIGKVLSEQELIDFYVCPRCQGRDEKDRPTFLQMICCDQLVFSHCGIEFTLPDIDSRSLHTKIARLKHLFPPPKRYFPILKRKEG